jgi:8-oxo-dGTP pyrophosphatase MutT (NUDIX family)
MKIDLTGAGFVIFFDNRLEILKNYPKDILYLFLIDYKDKYDFTKGTIDPWESSFECAVRETFEESGLRYEKNYLLYKNLNKTFSEGLSMFIGEYILDFDDLHSNTDLNKNISITCNDKGVIEHKDFIWETYENGRKSLPLYLKDVIEWAKTNI